MTEPDRESAGERGRGFRRSLAGTDGPWGTLAGTTPGWHYPWLALADVGGHRLPLAGTDGIVSSFVTGWGWSDAPPTHDVSPPA